MFNQTYNFVKRNFNRELKFNSFFHDYFGLLSRNLSFLNSIFQNRKQ